MSLLGTIGVKLTADTTAFSRDLKKAAGNLDSFASKSASVAKVAGAAFAALGAASAGVVAAYSTQIRAERQLASALKASGNAIDLAKFKEFASAIQGVTTTGDEAVIAMGSVLGRFGSTQDEIQKLIPSVLDLSAATGQSADGIAMMLGRALQSGQAALSRYGIALTKTEQELFKNGSQAERTSLILSKLGQFQGAAAIQAQDAAGRFNQLTNALGDVAEDIGKVLDKPLADVLERMTKAVQEMNPAFKSFAGYVLLIGTPIAGVVAALAGIGAALPLIAAGFAAVKAAVVALLPILVKLALPVLAVIAVLAGVVAGIGAVSMAFKANLGGMGDMWRDFTAYLKDLWDGAMLLLTDLMDGLVDRWLKFKSLISGVSEKTIRAEYYSGLTDVGGSGANQPDGGSFVDRLKDAVTDVSFTGAIGQAFSEGLKVTGVTGAMESLGETLGLNAAGEIENKATPAMEKAGEAAGEAAGTALGDELKVTSDMIKAGMNLAGPAGVARSSSGGIIANVSGGLNKGAGGMDVGGAFAAQGSRILDRVTSGGNIGSVIQGAQTGAQGGPLGMAAGALTSLAMQTESFSKIVEKLNGALGPVVMILDRILEPLVGLVEIITGIAVVFFKMATQLSGLETGITIFGFIVEKLTDALDFISQTLADTWNWVIDKFIWLAEKVLFGATERRVVRALNDAKINFDKQGEAAAEAGGGTEALAEATHAAAETVRQLNSSMTNVPSGFKVAAARFNSANVAELESAQFGGQQLPPLVVRTTGTLGPLFEALKLEADWEGSVYGANPALIGAT